MRLHVDDGHELISHHSRCQQNQASVRVHDQRIRSLGNSFFVPHLYANDDTDTGSNAETAPPLSWVLVLSQGVMNHADTFAARVCTAWASVRRDSSSGRRQFLQIGFLQGRFHTKIAPVDGDAEVPQQGIQNRRSRIAG